MQLQTSKQKNFSFSLFALPPPPRGGGSANRIRLGSRVGSPKMPSRRGEPGGTRLQAAEKAAGNLMGAMWLATGSAIEHCVLYLSRPFVKRVRYVYGDIGNFAQTESDRLAMTARNVRSISAGLTFAARMWLVDRYGRLSCIRNTIILNHGSDRIDSRSGHGVNYWCASRFVSGRSRPSQTSAQPNSQNLPDSSSHRGHPP